MPRPIHLGTEDRNNPGGRHWMKAYAKPRHTKYLAAETAKAVDRLNETTERVERIRAERRKPDRTADHDV